MLASVFWGVGSSGRDKGVSSPELLEGEKVIWANKAQAWYVRCKEGRQLLGPGCEDEPIQLLKESLGHE